MFKDENKKVLLGLILNGAPLGFTRIQTRRQTLDIPTPDIKSIFETEQIFDGVVHE